MEDERAKELSSEERFALAMEQLREDSREVGLLMSELAGVNRRG